MKKKLLYIHIGMHKTGTSAIGSFLSKNAALLLEQKVLYPNLFRDCRNDHHSLVVGYSA